MINIHDYLCVSVQLAIQNTVIRIVLSFHRKTFRSNKSCFQSLCYMIKQCISCYLKCALLLILTPHTPVHPEA